MADPLVLNGVSIPSNFPKALIDVNDNPSPGVVFRNAWSGGTWSMILDNEGNPVWYWHHWVEQMNFQKQPDGRITVGTFDDNGYYVIAWDSTYTKQGEYRLLDG
jgi:hypothetical protein